MSAPITLINQTQQYQLVEHLEACRALADPQTRVAIANQLPDAIRGRVSHAPGLRAYLTALVALCASHEGGLAALRDAILWYEGETFAMKAVDALLRKFDQQAQQSTPAATPQQPAPAATPQQPAPNPRPRAIFYSYAHADEARRDRLNVHLKLLERQGLIAPWHDRQIAPGSEWRDEIDHYLETADVILLLVSADFLASDYCWGVETKRALERQAAGEARVVPIILRPCDWHSAPFGKLQALPKDGRPVSKWNDEDEAWASIASALRQLVTSESAARGRCR